MIGVSAESLVGVDLLVHWVAANDVRPSGRIKLPWRSIRLHHPAAMDAKNRVSRATTLVMKAEADAA